MNTPEVPPRHTPSHPTASLPPPVSLLCAKVHNHHLQRNAIVYVRQSSPQQVRDNQESTRLQYAFQQQALLLGWHPSQVQVIDEDQAHTARTAEGRTGFQELMAQVAL